ncbi:MAG: hypothetical protein CMG00_01955 [Candidatus Marinimicrobia bacterium]|nr:hypothetical protein [Candidatus Neomarinimicrobiota bacterium]
MIFINIVLCWRIELKIEDIEGVAANDFVELGVCQNCHDGFHYGEDLSNIPTGATPYTDIKFFNFDWIGSTDENGNECNTPNFTIDFKSIHPPEDLLEWKIRGSTQGHTSPLRMTWKIYEMNYWEQENLTESSISEQISDDYDIFIYIGEDKYNLKEETYIDLLHTDLNPIYEDESGNLIPNGRDNIKILIGGCAETGTVLYFKDLDLDGLGSGEAYPFCPGSQPENYVQNNIDINDSIYCISNNIDDCNICNGLNLDKDCNGVCFGDSVIDQCGICDGQNLNDLGCGCFNSAPSGCDNTCGSILELDCNSDCGGDATLDNCNICSGGNSGNIPNITIDDCGDCGLQNQNCLNEIFAVLPYNISALIQNNSTFISWNFDEILESSPVQGFSIYHLDEDENLQLIQRTQNTYIETNQFTEGVFCVSIYDRFNNEYENSICTIASEYAEITYNLHEGANLISFPYIPEDNSLNNILEPINDYLDGIIGEGSAAIYSSFSGQFVGSINSIEHSKGYWLKMQSNIDNIVFNVSGFPINNNLVYELHSGFNLISYIGEDNLNINSAVDDELKEYIVSIIGEGEAAIYNNTLSQFVGSLSKLKFGKGYWVKTTSDISFYWNPY